MGGHHVLRAVFEKEDLVRRRHDAGAGEVLAEQGVEKRGLADVHLTHDHKDKGFLEAGGEVFDDRLGFCIRTQVSQHAT